MQPLTGWDLAAWRMSQADPALSSTVVGIVELSAIVSDNELIQRITHSVTANAVLRTCIVDDGQSVTRNVLPSINIPDHVEVKHVVVDIDDEIGEFAQRDFDVNRPLWRVLIIRTSEHSIIVSAFHHALADGQTAMVLLSHLFDGGGVPLRKAVPSESQHTSFNDHLRPVVERAVRDPLGLTKDISSVVQSVNRMLQVPTNISAQRSGAFHFTAFSLTPQQFSENIHDSMVAIAVDMWSHATDADKIVVNVPVAQSMDSSSANQFMIARLPMNADRANPKSLIASSRNALKEWRSQPATLLMPKLLELSNFIPSQLLATLLKQSDIAVSTVKGGSGVAAINGVPLKRVVPMVSPIGVGLNLTTAIVANEVVVGATADKAVFTKRSDVLDGFIASTHRILGIQPEVVHF